MTERGLPSADASPACPFVAFEDDRDARADRPDHRHRCFAEAEPAPRALAHQEAYCLSSAFPVCPVFQQWARREAAQARAVEASEAAEAAAATQAVTPADSQAEEWTAPPPGASEPPVTDPPIRRNPPRDWAAPPPWATGAGAAGAAAASGGGPRPASGGTSESRSTTPREAQGLAGSSADRLASGGSLTDVRSTAPDPDLAGLVAASGTAAAMPPTADERMEAQRIAERDAEMVAYARSVKEPAKGGRRPTVSSTRPGSAAPPKAAPREHVQDGPSWERGRRSEAYPQIRAAASLPGIPRVAVLAGALALAAVALFFLPALFGVGGDDPDSSSAPSASAAAATPTPEPTPEPAPTPQTYTIQEGDTLSGIAQDFDLTLEDLLAANETTIDDPNQISVGDVIIIPVPPADEVDGGSAAPEEEATPEP
jgi:LysM repeat protein